MIDAEDIKVLQEASGIGRVSYTLDGLKPLEKAVLEWGAAREAVLVALEKHTSKDPELWDRVRDSEEVLLYHARKISAGIKSDIK